MVTPSAGFILIAPPTKSFLTMPEGTKMLRAGIVLATGADIFHASGKVLPSPVEINDKVVFTYYEDEDFSIDGKPHYLVPFTRIVAYYAS